MSQIKLLVIAMHFFSCGNPIAEIQRNLDGINGKNRYKEKIVFDAVLIVNQQAKNIFIRRNIPLSSNLNNQIIASAEVILNDDITRDTLVFNTQVGGYYSKHPHFKSIKPAKKYTLTVRTTINGKQLTAQSSTITPSGYLNTILYEPNGYTLLATIPYINSGPNIQLQFTPIKDVSFYLMYLIPENNIRENLVENHVAGSLSEIFFDNDDYLPYIRSDIRNAGNLKKIRRSIPWHNIYFYSKYKFILYAGDKNFKDFYYTSDNIHGIDGNLSEPIFNISGDGIGIFASAIVDTLYFTITK